MTAQRMPQVSRDVKDAANAQDINRKNPSARRVDKIGLWGDSNELPRPKGRGIECPPAPYGSLTFALRGNAASGGEFTRHD